MKVYEFNCFLRVPASGDDEARERAQALADAVSHGEATLSLDDSEPFVEDEDEEESELPADRAERPSVAYGIPTYGQALDEIQVDPVAASGMRRRSRPSPQSSAPPASRSAT